MPTQDPSPAPGLAAAPAPQIQSGLVPGDDTTVTFPIPFRTEPTVRIFIAGLSLDYQGGDGKAVITTRMKLTSTKGFAFEVEHRRFGYSLGWIAHT